MEERFIQVLEPSLWNVSVSRCDSKMRWQCDGKMRRQDATARCDGKMRRQDATVLQFSPKTHVISMEERIATPSHLDTMNTTLSNNNQSTIA
jgi:hypothetical protein